MQSSVSHDPSEIQNMLICCMETFIITMLKKLCCVIFCGTCRIFIYLLLVYIIFQNALLI